MKSRKERREGKGEKRRGEESRGEERRGKRGAHARLVLIEDRLRCTQSTLCLPTARTQLSSQGNGVTLHMCFGVDVLGTKWGPTKHVPAILRQYEVLRFAS